MEHDAQGALPDIKHVVEIDAPIHKVWEAVSTSAGIAAWFMPNNFEPELGHEFTLQTPYGLTPCRVLELEAPYRLSFTWGDSGWRVSFRLQEIDGKTEFTLIHAGWGRPDDIIPEASEKHSVIRARMDEGWGYLTRGLRDKLAEA